MSQQILNLGTSANDGTGDTIRVGGQKIKDNFSEVYSTLDTITTDIDGKQDTLTISTVGLAVLNLTNPSAVTYLRFNADNTVDMLDAATFRTAIGAETSNFDGAYSSLSGLPDLTVYALLAGATFTGPVQINTNVSEGGLKIFGSTYPEIRVGADDSHTIQIYWDNGGRIGTTSEAYPLGITGSTLTLSPASNVVKIGTSAGGALQLKSPDGTAYNITVANGGAVTSTAA